MIEWILSAMLLLAPGRNHDELAGAIARAVADEPPLFHGDDDRRRTAALLVAVAFRESSFIVDAIGDKGESYCAFQIHRSSGGSKALVDDVDACARKALAMLRVSARVCPTHPVAWYAEGPRGCASTRARRISDDRIAIARWIAGHP